MRTVVCFYPTTGNRPNKFWTRSMRKTGFVDNRYSGPLPNPGEEGEQWLVEIVRENITETGGAFILKPIQCVQGQTVPLILGMYDMQVFQEAVILTPKDMTKFWVLAPNAKYAILEATGTHAIIVNHGGELAWPRRQPAESVLAREAKRLLDDKDK